MKRVWKILLGLIVSAALVLTGIVVGLYRHNDYVGIETDFSESCYLAAPPKPLEEVFTLKIMTFNIQDLYIVGKDRPARMRHIGRVLTELDPDIVGFQESFIDADRAILIEALSSSRLQYHTYYPSGVGGSGLLISSAWPIREAYFLRYSVSGLAWRVWEGDFWGGKGVALARVESPAGMLDIYNTHAQAGYGRPEYRIVRRKQMEELAAFVNASRTGVAPAFLVGDMNCRIGQEDYETAISKANLARTMNIESGIDHIFAVQDDQYRFNVLDTIRIWETITEGGRIFQLSDHAGFMSEIRIIPASDSGYDEAVGIVLNPDGMGQD